MDSKPSKSSHTEAILGLEMQISNLEDDLDHLTLDREIFSVKLKEMKKAVNFCRKEAYVVSLKEFRSLIADIKHTSDQIMALEVGISTVNDRIENNIKAIEHYNMLHEVEQEYLARKVLPFVRKTDDR